MKNYSLFILAVTIAFLSACNNPGARKLSTADSVNITNSILKSLKSRSYSDSANVVAPLSQNISNFFSFKTEVVKGSDKMPHPATIIVNETTAQTMINTYQAMPIRPFSATSFLIDAKTLFNYLDSGLNRSSGPVQNVQIILAIETDPTSSNYNNLTFVISTVTASGNHVCINDPNLGASVLEHCTPCPVCDGVTTILTQ